MISDRLSRNSRAGHGPSTPQVITSDDFKRGEDVHLKNRRAFGALQRRNEKFDPFRAQPRVDQVAIASSTPMPRRRTAPKHDSLSGLRRYRMVRYHDAWTPRGRSDSNGHDELRYRPSWSSDCLLTPSIGATASPCGDRCSCTSLPPWGSLLPVGLGRWGSLLLSRASSGIYWNVRQSAFHP